MTARLIIVGAGEFGSMACEYFAADSSYEVAGFAVESRYLESYEHMGLPVVALDDAPEVFPPRCFDAFVAVTYIHMNAERERLHRACVAMGYRMANFVSSRSVVGPEAVLLPGSFVMENCSVQRGARVGEGTVVWCGCNIAHGTEVGDYAWIAPGVSMGGFCHIERSCFVGVGVAIGDSVTVSERSLLGAGAVVTHSIAEPGAAFAGNPLKRLGRDVYERFAS